MQGLQFLAASTRTEDLYFLLVEFEDGKSKLIQSDFDQAAFAVDCGLIAAPPEWDGSPSDLVGETWEKAELTDITECPFVYYDIAE